MELTLYFVAWKDGKSLGRVFLSWADAKAYCKSTDMIIRSVDPVHATELSRCKYPGPDAVTSLNKKSLKIVYEVRRRTFESRAYDCRKNHGHRK